ncbi:hypothetical protein L226DRAFT_614441 [Lentinus tigrinus ALCF2SS1-7]|uniref:Uncharacterized protein n=1 Tax=Lentinus tigrinus ALCF2SS1-6 TaxID=1328759 RepID=A0A5C2S3Z8_9APHY|nr:hypothetical protein L227DRAFT_193901 [Lentinus tigrinus ALCF2SS1-6]RPD72859.1 hypothetical protein L226DRAFT_614441 [Lentinus tigrinus ALCF2SS1-7]
MARSRGRRKLGKVDSPDGVFAGGPARKMRSQARVILKRRIENKTGDKSATLWYEGNYYHRFVYMRRRIRIDRWPDAVPFRNLSDLTEAQLILLLDALKKRGKGAVRFVDVSDAEAAAHARDVEGVLPGVYKQSAIGLGHPGRSDVKKSRFKNGKPVSKGRKLRTKGAITPKYVDDSDME